MSLNNNHHGQPSAQMSQPPVGGLIWYSLNHSETSGFKGKTLEHNTLGIIVDERSLAQIFGLDEIRVARRLKLDKTTGQLVDIYDNVAILFYIGGTLT